MQYSKKIKDNLFKILFQISYKNFVPKSVFDVHEYFRIYPAIQFMYKKEHGKYIAISENFRYGSIITSAETIEQLEKEIEDAILTAFEVPSSYAKEVKIHKIGNQERKYALV